MKLMHAVLVLAGLGLVGTLAMWSGGAAAQAATPAVPSQPAKIGSSLIGKLEGPEIILDAKAFPKTFKEAPMLAEQVKAGKLPAVDKRLPEPSQLFVVKPLNEIGKIRRQLAQGLHRTGRPRKRQPHRFGRQDPDLRLHRHQDHPQPRPRLEGQRRRQDDDDLPPQRRQVVRRQALHGGRLHVLVRGHLSQQEHRPHAVLRVPDRRQGREDEEDRRLHRRLRIPRALRLFRLSAGGQHGHRRRVRHARRLPELRRRLRAGPLPEAVPAQVLVRGGGEQEGQGSRASTAGCRCSRTGTAGR